MSSTTLRAIETHYKGYRFRSRLEARWATFFDAMDMEWEYEPEGYVLHDGTCYLPDFWLPRLQTYVETKGPKPNQDEMLKCARLCCGTRRDVLLVQGLPGDWNKDKVATAYKYAVIDGDPCALEDHPCSFAHCSFCGYTGIVYMGETLYRYCPNCRASGVTYNDNNGHILSAYDAARSARFEHGETPKDTDYGMD